MKRVSPEDAARLQMDVEVEKASARLNMIINIAAFVVIVGVIRVGKVSNAIACSYRRYIMDV